MVTVHSPPWDLIVIPAEAGIHALRLLDSRLRGNDDHIGGLNGYELWRLYEFLVSRYGNPAT